MKTTKCKLHSQVGIDICEQCWKDAKAIERQRLKAMIFGVCPHSLKDKMKYPHQWIYEDVDYVCEYCKQKFTALFRENEKYPYLADDEYVGADKESNEP